MIKLLKTIYEKIWCIFAVTYWLQLYPCNKSFDEWCRESLEKGCTFENISEYTATFNGKTLWLKNHPNASFNLYQEGCPEISPSRYTKYLLKQRFNNSLDK